MPKIPFTRLLPARFRRAADTEVLQPVVEPISDDGAKKKRAKVPKAKGPLRRKIGSIRTRLASPDSPLLVYFGLTLIVAGFATLAFTWGKVAGLLAVPLQLPFITSGGLVGLGLVVVGLGFTSLAVKRREAFARVRKLQKLAATLDSIASGVAARDRSEEVG
jgi:hypothetical protein